MFTQVHTCYLALKSLTATGVTCLFSADSPTSSFCTGGSKRVTDTPYKQCIQTCNNEANGMIVTRKLLKLVSLLQNLDEKTRVQLILAYLPSLTHLNGGRITETEKEDAERAFIRRYMDQDEKPAR